MGVLTLWLTLVGFHFLADYPLQGDFLSKAKNRRVAFPGTPWWQAMAAHAGIHALMVGLVTGVWWLALLEFACHFWIDDLKCRGELTFNQDQALHFGCKALWVLLLVVRALLS